MEAFIVEMSQLCRIYINKDFILYVHDSNTAPKVGYGAQLNP